MKATDSAVFSKNSDEWETPAALFEILDKEFHFQVDAAATKENAKLSVYFEDLDAVPTLETNWYLKDAWERFWLNPPYSKIGAFMKKAYEESLKGAVVVCLIPSRTDTAYWHDYCMKAHEIRFIRGRLKFGDGKGSAPFPSCIVIFKNKSVTEQLENPYYPAISAMERPK
jgi:site-specific DNA-methyltransferase (adenine-specific)